MSENTRKVWNYFKEAGVGAKFTYREVAEALGIKIIAVGGATRKAIKEGWIEKSSDYIPDGNGIPREVSFLSLTELGANTEL